MLHITDGFLQEALIHWGEDLLDSQLLFGYTFINLIVAKWAMTFILYAVPSMLPTDSLKADRRSCLGSCCIHRFDPRDGDEGTGEDERVSWHLAFFGRFWYDWQRKGSQAVPTPIKEGRKDLFGLVVQNKIVHRGGEGRALEAAWFVA